MTSDTLQQSVSQWWLAHFEAIQVQEDNENLDLKVVAARLCRELQLIQVNHGMQSMDMGGKTKISSQSASSALSMLWREIFVPACLAAEGNDAVATSKHLLAVMSAVGQQLDLAEDMIDLAKRASEAAIDSVRALGTHMLGHLRQADALIPRLTDKSVTVRASAIVATGFLLQRQDDSDLLEALLWNVWHDPSVPNRVSALQALPASEQVWDHVIARLRDVKEKVRLAAVGVLRQKVSTLQQLSSTQLAEIVQNGIGVVGSPAGHRCQATKTATIELVCAHWMKLAKFNILNLLQRMDVLSDEDEAEQVIRIVLQATVDSNDIISTLSPPEKRAFQASISNHLMTLDEGSTELTPEQFLLARVAAMQNPGYLAMVVPDMGVICDIFQKFSGKEGNQALFIGLQLLQLATVVGMEEEGSRRRFIGLLQAVLTSSPVDVLPDPLIEASVKALLTLQDGSMNTFDEIIGELKRMCANDSALSSRCTLRILAILCIVLEEAKVTYSMRDFLRNVSCTVEEAIASRDNLLREAGVACLAKVGLFSDKDLVVHTFKPLLLSVASSEEQPLTVRSQAVMALSDWALVFEEVLQVLPSGVSLRQVLGSLLQSENVSVAAIAAEATAKLLFAGRLCESTLIADLLVLFFDPKFQSSTGDVEDNVGSLARMQQWLSLFFPAYCLQSKMTRDAVLGALEDALKIGATKKSFPIVKVVEYVCEVVSVEEEEVTDEQSACNDEANNYDDSHTALKIALQVAPFILHVLSEEERSGKKIITLTVLRALCKLLGSLEVDGPYANLIQLRDTMDELAMMLTDPTALRTLNDLTRDLAQVREEDNEDDETREGSNEASVTNEDENTIDTTTEHLVALNKENTAVATPADSVPIKNDLSSSRSDLRVSGLRASRKNSGF